MAEFEWDPSKASSNHAKHGVHFADAVGVFEDDFAITIEDGRDDTIRLISAREATARQCATYEETRR